jgi:hypothetical protein
MLAPHAGKQTIPVLFIQRYFFIELLYAGCTGKNAVFGIAIAGGRYRVNGKRCGGAARVCSVLAKLRLFSSRK